MWRRLKGLRPYRSRRGASPLAASGAGRQQRKTAKILTCSIIGFLLGLTGAGIAGSSYLKEDYTSASSFLLTAVEDLQASTSRVTNSLQRIQNMENKFSRLEAAKAEHADIDAVRKEMKQLHDSLLVEILESRSRIVELETELSIAQRSPKQL